MKKEEEIINRYLDQRLNPEELEELDQLLQKDSLLRKKFYNQSNVVTALEEEFEQTEASPKVISISSSKTKFNLYALAACLLIGLGIFQLYLATHSPEIIATLKENENAAWESSLPTTAGSKLRPGIMNLKAGVATIRFSSGAEITLEAPAEIEIQNPMRAKINRGNIVVHVPEPHMDSCWILQTGMQWTTVQALESLLAAKEGKLLLKFWKVLFRSTR